MDQVHQEERFNSSPSPSPSSTSEAATSSSSKSNNMSASPIRHQDQYHHHHRHHQRRESLSLIPCNMGIMTSLSILLLTLTVIRAETTCELEFDTVYCDYNTSTGYGFVRDEIWNIECYDDEINVIQSSARPSPYGQVDVVFSDTQYIYVIKGQTVFVTMDDTFTGYDHRMTVKDLFSGFDQRIVSAFFYREQVFIFDGVQFTILNQRVYRIGNQPLWSFKRADDMNKKLMHDKLSNLKVSLVVPIEGGQGHELLLLLKGNQYYRMSSIDFCLPTGSGSSKLPDVCFWDNPKELDTLISCVLISWKLLLLIIGISLLAILITCYICCLIICYRRKRKSGTFKHEKQNCCSQDGDFYFPEEDKETGKLQPNGHSKTNGNTPSNGHAHNGTSKPFPTEPDYLETASSIVDTFDTYDEDRISIDLREGSYR